MALRRCGGFYALLVLRHRDGRRRGGLAGVVALRHCGGFYALLVLRHRDGRRCGGLLQIHDIQEDKMAAIIGLMPLVDDERESYWMLPGYMKGISEAGGIPIMLPLTDDPVVLAQLAATCSGFLFTGGHDVSPSVYGEERIVECGECSRERDSMEKILLDIAIKEDKPVLGICRGIQFLNAACGGTLYQDLPLQHPSDVNHHQSPPYNVPVHDVKIVPGSPLHSLLDTDTLHVNSYHHQAIRGLSPALKPMAYSTDGLTEAVFMPSKSFIWAVQWHPEFSHETDENSRKIFSAFVQAAQLQI